MKIRRILILLVILFIFIPPSLGELSEWSYKRKIIIDNTQNSNSLVDYQVLVENPVYNESDLVLSYHFDKSDYSYDSSGYLNDGKLMNGPTFIQGKFGDGIKFDGIDDFIEGKDSPSLNIRDEITIAWWGKFSQEGHKQDYWGAYILTKTNYSGPAKGKGYYFSTLKNLRPLL